MKKTICLAVLGIGVILCLYGIKKQTGTGDWNMTRLPPEQKVLQTTNRGTVEKITSNRQENAKPFRSRVYKPKSLQVGQGGATVVEIDHGLTPVNRFDGERYSEDVQRGKRNGAIGAITLRVVDTAGTPVAGAELFGGFWNNNSDDQPATGTSDENGEISLEHVCTGDLNFSITKDGYYKSVFRYWFFKTGFDCAKDGRWLPWNPTVEVVLKEKRKPVAICMKYVDSPIPVHGEPVGFDFEKGDWIAPFGKGARSDMQLFYKRTEDEETKGVCNDFSILFTNLLDGAYLTAKDEYSEFKSAYDADQNAVYLNKYQYVSEGVPGKILRNEQMGESEVMIFRVRTELDAEGKIRSVCYGVIHGPLQFAQGHKRNVRFLYYFNPVENDTNLEFDCTHNLLGSN